jgi:hypothetical protein
VIVGTFNFLFIEASVTYIILASVFSTTPHAFFFRFTAKIAIVSFSFSRVGTKVRIAYADWFVIYILIAAVFADIPMALLTTKEIQLLRLLFCFASFLANIAPNTGWELEQSPSKILNDMALSVFSNNSGSSF